MTTLITLIAWVTINGFPLDYYETCKQAQTRATELQERMPDLQVRAVCNPPKPETGATIDYYGPRVESGEDHEETPKH